MLARYLYRVLCKDSVRLLVGVFSMRAASAMAQLPPTACSLKIEVEDGCVSLKLNVPIV